MTAIRFSTFPPSVPYRGGGRPIVRAALRTLASLSVMLVASGCATPERLHHETAREAPKDDWAVLPCSKPVGGRMVC